VTTVNELMIGDLHPRECRECRAVSRYIFFYNRQHMSYAESI